MPWKHYTVTLVAITLILLLKHWATDSENRIDLLEEAMGETLAHKNQEYWNQASRSVFKDKWVHDLQKQISEFLTSNIDWIGIPQAQNNDTQYTKLMDYACGNGIVSQSLYHLFSRCIGIDLSDGMLDKYRATAVDLSLDESRMSAVRGDLLSSTVEPTKPVLSDEELSGFDLVAICMALHHVDDIELATKRLAERLRPGGVLLIIDWATRNSSTERADKQRRTHHHGHHTAHGEVNPAHPAAHTISHDSFTHEQIVGIFNQAGCGESRFQLANRLSDVPGARTGKMQLFWARATKL